MLEELQLGALRLQVGVFDLNMLCIGPESSYYLRLIEYHSVFEKIDEKNIL